MRPVHRSILAAVVPTASALLLSGCSLLEQLGNGTLDLVGLGADKQEYSQTEALANATQTFTNEEEYYLGRAVAARILSLYPEVKDDALYTYVNLVGRAVAAFSDRPNTFGGYHFAILDSDEVTALAAPGGFIFVSKGFLRALPDEDALAAVLAHEVTHVVQRHGIKSISKEHTNEALATLGQLAGSLNCGQVLAQATILFGSAVDDVVDTLVEKGYSREQEFEADQGALVLLERARYDRAALEEVFAQLDLAGQDSDGGWFETHPSTEDRRQAAGEFTPVGGAATDAAGKVVRLSRYERALTKIRS